MKPVRCGADAPTGRSRPVSDPRHGFRRFVPNCRTVTRGRPQFENRDTGTTRAVLEILFLELVLFCTLPRGQRTRNFRPDLQYVARSAFDRARLAPNLRAFSTHSPKSWKSTPDLESASVFAVSVSFFENLHISYARCLNMPPNHCTAARCASLI